MKSGMSRWFAGARLATVRMPLHPDQVHPDSHRSRGRNPLTQPRDSDLATSTIQFAQSIACLILLACMSITVARAPTVTGSVTGEVTDASGAIIPGAHVVAHNIATGVDTPAVTNATGVYRIEFLPIG